MMSNELLQMLDKCNNRRVILTQKNKQLEQRIADLEQQLAEAHDGWTYVEDGLPPMDTDLLMMATRKKDGKDQMRFGWFDSVYEWSDQDGIPMLSWNVRAWKLAPQPAPLRTAASAEEPTP